MPDSTGDPRDSMIGLFSAVRKDYGPAGVRVELGHVGILPVWGENNRNDIAAGRTKTAVIRPILMDREIPRLQARLDDLNRAVNTREAIPPGALEKAEGDPAMTAEEKKQFIDLTNRLKLLADRRALLLARTGDDFVTEPPKVAGK